MNDLKKIKFIKFSDIAGIFLFVLFLIPSLILKLKYKITNKKLWLVTELKDTARDNGYHFFKYMRKIHPDEKCYYAINKDCKDFQKIKNMGNIIEFSSIKYWIYYMAADKNIITNKATDPSHLLFYVLHKYLNLYNNCVFLQHGITKDDAPMFYYKNAKFKLFICGAKKEYEYISKKFGYPESNVKYTGFARFDNLHNLTVKNNQILIMPTWRNWLGRDVNMLGKIEKFTETEYFTQWNGLINSPKFIKYIEDNNLKVKFYPHYQMHKYINDFNINSKNIEILDNDKEDIQQLLRDSAILITDYSSVYMDFAYMLKPVIYFQFDIKEYREKQLQQGYFEYERDGFGKVLSTSNAVIENIINYNLKFVPEEKYLNRMKDFFELRDSKNCERIYKEIKNLK